MNSDKIRLKFIKYFAKNKKFPHKEVLSSSLWPKDDPSVLLTTAGMQQFKPYFMGIKDPKKEFGSTMLVSSQRCFRTSDIEEVGDGWHNTFFEMLGNFSIGAYTKNEAIDLAWKFLTKELKFHESRLWTTYFSGNTRVAKDHEAIQIWKQYIPKERIVGYGKKDNWWGPQGNSGPCGPCSEIHYDLTGVPCSKDKHCLPNCECGRFVEIWNLVFMEFHMDTKKAVKPLPTKSIDTGMGLERLAVIHQSKKNIFGTDLFSPLIKQIIRDPNFGSTSKIEDEVRSYIVADHIKSAVFLLADGITFSNKEQGYILRRIFRRALDQYLHQHFSIDILVDAIILIYRETYPYLGEQRDSILKKMNTELSNYSKVLKLDVEEIVKKMVNLRSQTKTIPRKGPSSRVLAPEEAFKLYATYGLSADRLKRKGFTFDEKKFQKEIEKHQSLSRAGAQKKFGGHGIDSSEWSFVERKKMTRLHTATHLLHQSLRTILGNQVQQEGSDINPKRLRFDFRYDKKLTDDELKRVENLVNDKIQMNIQVTSEEMEYSKALKVGALAFFKEKYPEKVTVYSIGDFSKELCGGPHVTKTGEIGKFKINSEKSSSAGVRRIKAEVE